MLIVAAAGWYFLSDSSQYKQKNGLSPDKNDLLISLKSLEPMFVQPPNEDSVSFNLYYQYPDSLNSNPVTLSLAAAKDKIWLFPNKLLQTNSAEFLQHIGVDSNTGEVTSSKGKALYDLSRMILSQYYSQLSLNKTVDFKQEAIIPLTQNMATGELKSYQPQLDIELQSQWQSGPFAIGRILLNLPTAFKTHTTVFQSSGQSIKLDQILIKPVKMSRQNIQFEISGKIDDLGQLRLFNLKNELISETLEFKQISTNKALLTLIYTDTIDKIKLYLAQDSTQKEYPVKFTQN